MADLSFKEKRILERFLDMGRGYVLDFSNKTMQDFIFDTMGVDIYNEKYSIKGESKANRLRTFWEIESNYHTGRLIEQLLDYWMTQVQTGERDYDYTDENLYKECTKISERLKARGPAESLDVIEPKDDDESFDKLAKSVKQSIINNEPEVGLDRLHTYMTKFLRKVCAEHGIKFDKDTPLHSLTGMYVKHLKAEGLIESEMTERILKSSISVMEAFNHVRNDHSLAHDNNILGYHEALLIFNDILNFIRFVEGVESSWKEAEDNNANTEKRDALV